MIFLAHRVNINCKGAFRYHVNKSKFQMIKILHCYTYYCSNCFGNCTCTVGRQQWVMDTGCRKLCTSKYACICHVIELWLNSQTSDNLKDILWYYLTTAQFQLQKNYSSNSNNCFKIVPQANVLQNQIGHKSNLNRYHDRQMCQISLF